MIRTYHLSVLAMIHTASETGSSTTECCEKKIIKALLFIVCSLRLAKCHAIATIFYGKEHYCQDFSKLDQPKRIFLSGRRPAIFIICESPRV